MFPGTPRRFAMRFFLPPLVGFCSIGESVIFLDARSDRYWMLPAVMSQALNRLCAGAEFAGDEAAPLLALVRAGLLDSTKGEPLVPCQLPRARTSRLEVIDTTPRSSTMIAGLCFAASTWRIRRRGLGCELAGLQRRQERQAGTLRNVDRHAGAFARLRLLVSPAGHCLPLSLALVGLLLAAMAVADGLDPDRHPSLLSPLVSQPIAEAALRVPSWMWFEEGRNRVPVRQAYAARLPASVVGRRSKGTPTGFLTRLVEKEADMLRPFLLDGCLAVHGVIDRAAVEAALAPGPARDLRFARLLQPASPNSLLAGSVIAASLITGLNSDLPGMVTAQVTQNVFDTVTGTILLVPQGARLIGKYDSVVAFGQRRALVIWQRLILPDGGSIRLDNMPATDPAGYAGLADRVDFHTWTLLKGVAIATMLGVGSELSISGGSDLVQAIRQSAQMNAARAGDQITQRNLDIQPTITIRPGAPVRVLVTRDLILAPWRGREN